jgi:hypothetical protein
MSKVNQEATTARPVERFVPTTAFVRKQYFIKNVASSDEVATEETIQVHRFLTEPAKVNFALGLTLNLGNFESARIDIGIVAPCYKEESEAAYVFAKEWVEKKLSSEVQEVRSNTKRSIF